MMISNHDRRFVAPILGPPNKRKIIDGPNPPFNKKPNNTILGPLTQTPNNKKAQNNQILAGYLAHEFLTKGSLFGEAWDPARAEAVPVSADSRREKREKQPRVEKIDTYNSVSNLLKTDGVCLPGVVNPTQLGRFLQL